MRASGVLMHISSLPNAYGIGSFGKSAYKFVDMLEDALQTYWQILPLCPTSFGDSPYQSFSTFAGNPYFIDLEILCEQGLLNLSDFCDIDFGDDKTKVDYQKVYLGRNKVFDKLQKNFFAAVPKDFDEFCKKESFWLEDYSLFMAIKEDFSGLEFTKWTKPLRDREHTALEQKRESLQVAQARHKMLQYLFYKQWFALKNYANSKGIKIIGDLPIYVAADSADVWANPKNFLLDKENLPTLVAGCPPDDFSETGQLWGNPVYDWDYMKKCGYDWWVERIRSAGMLYDLVRIDHFRGFDSFYCIKYGSVDAKVGEWRNGPGMDLFNELKNRLGKLNVIAEDLGFLTPSVKQLLKDSNFPGMKVLQFAFGDEDSDYLPHNYTKNSVVYTGTHDNDTILGWIDSSSKAELKFAKKYMGWGKLNRSMMKTALSSVSDTAILTMQDILELDRSARMNLPNTVGINWLWRVTDKQLNKRTFKFLKKYTKLYSRARNN